jgi:hypothetical protein
VTLNVRGKPFELRVANGPNILNPTLTRFEPPAGSVLETFSANFVGGQESNGFNTVEVEWRLVATGGSATLQAGSVVVVPGSETCEG